MRCDNSGATVSSALRRCWFRIGALIIVISALAGCPEPSLSDILSREEGTWNLDLSQDGEGGVPASYSNDGRDSSWFWRFSKDGDVSLAYFPDQPLGSTMTYQWVGGKVVMDGAGLK